MKKTALSFLLTLLCLGLFAVQMNIPEDWVALDEAGNKIYQIQNGEIVTGFKVIGEGEPLLMVMGLGETMDGWSQTVLDIFARDYQLILLDNRGMGYSTDTDKPFTYAMLGEDVINLMDLIGLKKTNIFGWSMGSIISQYLVLNHGNRIDRAILNATAIDSTGTVQNFINLTGGDLPTEGTVKKQLDYADSWKADPEDLKKVKNPVLLIHGSADVIVPVENAVRLAEYIPDAWLVRFKDNTHSVLFEEPVDFAYVCLDFLNHKRR
jgi:pimeloyl-ACP methyl ester carboxylesterase